MPASESFVKFEKVDKSYDGEVLVVKDLNVDIPKGEFLTMLGPSGSGKTTTLMMLAGFETPTNGEIYLDGDAISSIPPYKRGIGMVFQNYALFPHMTVNENLAFPLEVRKLNKSEIKEKVEKALSMVELQDFGNRMPLQLSGGQQQPALLLTDTGSYRNRRARCQDGADSPSTLDYDFAHKVVRATLGAVAATLQIR